MSKLSTTLMVDGTPVEPDSPRAVELYLAKLREAESALDDARVLLHLAPEPVVAEWLKVRDQIHRKLGQHIGPVARFNDDFTKRGLESALGDARFRKEL